MVLLRLLAASVLFASPGAYRAFGELRRGGEMQPASQSRENCDVDQHRSVRWATCNGRHEQPSAIACP
jgi:hypothetical protein